MEFLCRDRCADSRRPNRTRLLFCSPTGGADFSCLLNAKRGSYIMLGGGRSSDDAMLHHPGYDFNDEILPIGASYWATLAEQLLPRDV